MTKNKSLQEIIFQGIIVYHDRIELKKEAKEKIHQSLLSLIGETHEIYFSKDIPTFKNLEEYMEHTVKVRDQLRAELRTAIKEWIGGF